MIRFFQIWLHRASIKTAISMLESASPAERAVLEGEIAASRARLLRLES